MLNVAPSVDDTFSVYSYVYMCIFCTGTKGLGPNVMATLWTRWLLSMLLANLLNCLAQGRLILCFCYVN